MAEDTPKRGPGRPPRVSVVERNPAADPAASVLLEEYLKDPRYKRAIEQPFGSASTEILLKDPQKVARWGNAAVGPDHIHGLKAIGYDFVRPEEVADLDQLGWYQLSPAGNIARGERGQEPLLSIPRVVREARQVAKTTRNLDDVRDYDKQKRTMLDALAKEHGGEAADYANAHVGPAGYIRDGRERIQVTPEAE